MAKIYISSTYLDLSKHREAVMRSLYQMDKVVVAMENYTASDERPLDRCLVDVAACDVYVGIFAHRYGYIPDQANPDSLSITELEYRQASRLNKPRLVFLVTDDAAWLPAHMDGFTGEGEAGRRIAALKADLRKDKMAGSFRGPDDLAASVTAAIARWQEQQHEITANVVDAPIGPHPRELVWDLLVAYSAVDLPKVTEIVDYLRSTGLRVSIDPLGFLAGDAAEFQRLDATARECRAAVIVISDVSLRQIEERPTTARMAIQLIADRAAPAFALCLSPETHRRVSAWGWCEGEDVSDWHPRLAPPPEAVGARLRLLDRERNQSLLRAVGLPFIIVAMNSTEATQLERDPDLVRRELGSTVKDHFEELRSAVKSPLPARYGPRRLDWRPFGPDKATIETVLTEIVRLVNEHQPTPLKGRLIKPQNYSFEGLLDEGSLLRPIVNELSRTGCVVVVDEYSLFHPSIQNALVSSALFGSEQVAIVTISPDNPYAIAPFALLEAELNHRLSAAYDRFASSYDPQCELSVGDVNRLRRWLHGSLPRTVQALRDLRPNRQRLAEFATEVGGNNEPRIASLLYSKAPL